MLTREELLELDKRIGRRADRWLSAHTSPRQFVPKPAITNGPAQSRRGRKSKALINPFYTHLGPASHYGRYPGFAQDIVEGIARLDWHARPLKTGSKSMPLSVRKCFVILEVLGEVTTAGVQELFGYSQSQAQRYVKAIELIIPFLLKVRPASLVADMTGESPQGESPWTDELESPTADTLAKMHYDLRTLGE